MRQAVTNNLFVKSDEGQKKSNQQKSNGNSSLEVGISNNVTHFSLFHNTPKNLFSSAATNNKADRFINQSVTEERRYWSTPPNLTEDKSAVNQFIKASQLDVGMMLSINGRLEKIVNINKVEQWIEEEVPVQDIQPGDEVLSLNDRTGKWEWHKVEAALFKGIQDLYELVTSQGKRIRTTREHPYFVQIMGNSNQDLRGSPLINGKWLKVNQLKVEMAIATIDGWEKISSINKVKRQRVYDLQIENTHNFVANDIVAHNTLIGNGGNVGVGWTSPVQLFQINPNVGIGLTINNTFVVTSQGNVGVGNSAPRSLLDIYNGSLLQTPTNPTYIGGADIAAANNSVFVSGRYAYMATAATNELQIYDVTNPNSSASIGSADLGGTGNSIYVSGKYAYIGRAAAAGTCSSTTNTGCEFLIYDVSNPASPLFIGGADDGGDNANAVFVSGRYAYVVKDANTGTCSSRVNTGCELQIYDVSNPTSPVFVGGADDAATAAASDAANSIFISGRYAYLAKAKDTGSCSSSTNTGCELQIYDVSNPTSPVFVGGADVGGPGVGDDATSVFVSGRYAYLSKEASDATCNPSDNTGCEFQIYDVSNPTNPTFVGGQNVGLASAVASANAVFVSGRYAYVGINTSGAQCSATSNPPQACELQVLDVSNPSSPIFIGGVEDGEGNANEVFVSGRFIYLGKAVNAGTCSSTDNTGCELQVYDVSGLDVTSAIIGSLEAGGLQVRENALINNQLYVGGGLGVGAGGLLSQGMVGIGVSSGTTGLLVEMIGARGTGSTAPSAIFNGGNVGIGSTETSVFPTLSSMLYIAGNVGIGWTNTGGATPAIPGLGLSVFGNVGIGTTSPAYGLHIIGNVGIGASLTVGSALQLQSYNCSGLTNLGKLTADSAGRVICLDDTSGGGSLTGSGAAGQVTFWTTSTNLSGNNAFFWNNGLNRLGIGSSAPGSTLGVFGSVGIGSSYGFATLPASAANGLVVQGNIGVGTSNPTASLYVAGNVGIGWTGVNLSSAMPSLGLAVFGNVGIGTTTTQAALHVESRSGIAAIFDGGGNVGIGTKTPLRLLDVNATIVKFGDNTSAPTLANNGDFAIGSADTTATGGRIWVRSNGITSFRFNSVANTADYSEYIKQQDSSEPGDVMVLISENSECQSIGGSECPKVRKSQSSYDENIIGVITTRGTSYNVPEPYYSSDTPVGPEYANVGMLGQVWVKVNLENGPIYVGDPLTSSSTLGMAMKAIKPGRIIGRAMEDYTALRDTVSSTGAPAYQILMQVNVTWWEAEQLIQRQDSGMLYLDGNLGIGTTMSGYGLAVEGSIFSTSSINTLGNLGIGTTNPLYGLDIIKEASSSASASIVNLSTSDNTDTSGLRIGLGTPISGVSSNFIDFYAGVASDSAGVRVGRIRLNDNKVAYESVGADFAEYFDTLDEVEDGDLVSVGSEYNSYNDYNGYTKKAQVKKSSTPYDQNLVGVVSKDAAFVGNASYTSEVKQAIVGLLGQIKTKVSNINGQIKKGDYLTSSSIPGVAQKATHPGQVIGKALEDFPANPDNTPGVENCAYTPGVECGQILVLIKPGFADPGNFLSSLSMDNEGNLIIPKLKAGSITVDPGLTTSSSSLRASEGSVAILTNTEIASSSATPRNDIAGNIFYDLTGKIASLEDRVKSLENVIASERSSRGDLTTNQIATSSPSASPRNDVAAESTPSADLASSTNSELNLTPPDILLATSSASLTTGGSAVLTDVSVTSNADIGGLLTAYQAQIQDNFSVFGTSTLGDTLIAGNLVVDGTLSISSGNTIDVIGSGQVTGDSGQENKDCNLYPESCNLSGILYLQKSPLAQGVDIFNGKITLNKDGTIKAKTLIVDQIKVNQNQSAGQAIIRAGKLDVIVENPYVSEDSIIFITPIISDEIPLNQTPAVVDKVKGGFLVKLAYPEAKDILFNYLVMGVQKIVSLGGP